MQKCVVCGSQIWEQTYVLLPVWSVPRHHHGICFAGQGEDWASAGLHKRGI